MLLANLSIAQSSNYETMTIEQITDKITLIHGDCMEYMRSLPDNAFDLACVDPPYQLNGKSVNSSRHSGSGKLKNRFLNKSAKKFREWDIAPTAEYFSEIKRVATNRIIWGGNYFDLPPTRGIICWDKCQPWQNFSQVELAWTSFDKPAKLFKCDNRKGGKIHPCQKPTALYKWLFENYAKPTDNIVDTHLGSGSSAIAAYDLGFEFVGIEIDEEYYANAKTRLLRHIESDKRQPKLNI